MATDGHNRCSSVNLAFEDLTTNWAPVSITHWNLFCNFEGHNTNIELQVPWSIVYFSWYKLEFSELLTLPANAYLSNKRPFLYCIPRVNRYDMTLV